VGAGSLQIDYGSKTMSSNGTVLKEGDVITLNGTRGLVYKEELPLIEATENPRFQTFMRLVDQYRTMGVRTNADTPADAKLARELGAEGIGLFRTEHMFYGEGSEEPLFCLRKMILSETEEQRRKALEELFPYMKRDIKATLEAMAPYPVTIRLLDPPLHEFVPKSPEKQKELAEALGISVEEVKARSEALHETNPMMGHRGVRLGITYPEITETQVRAILEAAAELIKDGIEAKPEIMVPVTCDVKELDITREIVDRVHQEVSKKYGLGKIDFLYGTMVEIPRAAILAGEMARTAEFFSFGTNDLTQMTFGFSRDDTAAFMQDYIDKGILKYDPFQVLDQKGVGKLIEWAVTEGRKTRPDLKVGICGEHGGEPSSVKFLFNVGLNYVSCSPYRVPIARLAAAQASLVKKELVSVER